MQEAFAKEASAIEGITTRGKQQIAAAAICACVYETLPDPKILLGTKQKAVRGCKQRVKLLEIACPPYLRKRLDAAMKDAEKNAKTVLAEAKKAARGGAAGKGKSKANATGKAQGKPKAGAKKNE